METAAEYGTCLFQLSHLHEMYENRLNEFIQEISINRTRLKKQLLDHFKDTGLQEQFLGKSIILAFPEGIQEMLKN